MSSFSIKAGTIIDDFIMVDEVLGRGGMGLVYKSTHLILKRPMALKVLDPNIIGDAQFRNRFKREAQALSRLSHRNIVGFYHFGLWKDAIPYIAMELLQGTSLEQVLLNEPGGMSAERIRGVVLQVAEALAFAHSNGVIHRDLKPSNIMLVNEPAMDTVKLLDFGLARLDPTSIPGAEKLTKTGSLLGTVLYMSPEQSRGEKVDKRADVYSLGCIIHEMLSGKPPFDAENAVGIMIRHQNESPPMISKEILSKAPLCEQLASIAEKCMAKDAAKRYQNMEALIDDLRSESGEISAPSIHRSRHSPRLLAASVIAGLVCLLAAAFLFADYDSWRSALEMQYIRISADKEIWRFGLQKARLMKQKHKLNEASGLFRATLDAAEKVKTQPMDLAKIKLELAATLIEMEQKPESAIYASQALVDFAAAAGSKTDWVILDAQDFEPEVRKTVQILLQIPHKDPAVRKPCETLQKKFQEHKEYICCIEIAKLQLALAWQVCKRGEPETALNLQRALAHCYLLAGMRKEASAELLENIHKSLRLESPQDAAAALYQYAQSLDADELKKQEPRLMRHAANAMQLFSSTLVTQFFMHKFHFRADMAQFFFVLKKNVEGGKLLHEATIALDAEMDPGESQSECFHYLAKLFRRYGYPDEALSCGRRSLASLRAFPGTIDTFPLLKYVTVLDFLWKNGHVPEANAEFDQLIINNFSGKNVCEPGQFLYWSCAIMMKDPERALHWHDRVIALRKEQGIQAELYSAMEGKYLTLSKLSRNDEALDEILAAARLKKGNTSSLDWQRQSACLWTACVLLLARDNLVAAKKLIEEFKAPAILMNDGTALLLDWCRLLILAREGNEQDYQKLRARLALVPKDSDTKRNYETWFRMTDADLLIVQKRYAEAWKLVSTGPSLPGVDVWAPSKFITGLRNRIRIAVLNSRTPIQPPH